MDLDLVKFCPKITLFQDEGNVLLISCENGKKCRKP